METTEAPVRIETIAAQPTSGGMVTLNGSLPIHIGTRPLAEAEPGARPLYRRHKRHARPWLDTLAANPYDRANRKTRLYLA